MDFLRLIMTAQEALNKALWNKLPEEVRISIMRSVGEGKLAVPYENPNPRDTKILKRLGYHITNSINGLTYISWNL